MKKKLDFFINDINGSISLEWLLILVVVMGLLIIAGNMSDKVKDIFSKLISFI